MERGGVAQSQEHWWSRFQVKKANQKAHRCRALRFNKLLPPELRRDGLVDMLANDIADLVAVQPIDQLSRPNVWIYGDW